MQKRIIIFIEICKKKNSRICTDLIVFPIKQKASVSGRMFGNAVLSYEFVFL